MSSAARVQTPFSRPAGDTGPGDTGTGGRSLRARFHRDSPLWLVLVAVLFLLAEFSPGLLRMPLGADEITYIAQTSVHASQVLLPPVHGRGCVAAGGTGDAADELCPGLAGVAGGAIRARAVPGLAGLARAAAGLDAGRGRASFSAAWPCHSSAGSRPIRTGGRRSAALAVAGLFIQAVTGRMRDIGGPPAARRADPFFLLMLRFQDTVFVLAPVIAAGIIVPAWRNRRVLAAFGVGLVVAAAEWIGEAYAWYGGPLSRLHLSAEEPPKFARVLLASVSAPRAQRAVVLPTRCVSQHGLSLAEPVVAGAARAGRPGHPRRQAAGPGLVDWWPSWPRSRYSPPMCCSCPSLRRATCFPCLALLIIPAADGIGWLATVPRWRAVGRPGRLRVPADRRW